MDGGGQRLESFEEFDDWREGFQRPRNHRSQRRRHLLDSAPKLLEVEVPVW